MRKIKNKKIELTINKAKSIIISPIIIKSKFSIFKTQNLKFHFVRSALNLPAMLLGLFHEILEWFMFKRNY